MSEVDDALALIRDRLANSDKLLATKTNEVRAAATRAEKLELKLATAEQRYEDLRAATEQEIQQLKQQADRQLGNAQLEAFINGVKGLSLPVDVAERLAKTFAAAFPHYKGGAARVRATGTAVPTTAAKDVVHAYLETKFKNVQQCKTWLTKWAAGQTDFPYDCGWRTMVAYCSDVLERTYTTDRHYLDTAHGAELYEHLVGGAQRRPQPTKERKQKLF